jgi:hypothetical protein
MDGDDDVLAITAYNSQTNNSLTTYDQSWVSAASAAQPLLLITHPGKSLNSDDNPLHYRSST